MSQELKPCPFCGGDARISLYNLSFWRAYCSSCGTEIVDFRIKRDCIISWNTRHLTPKQQCADEMYDLLDRSADIFCENGYTQAMREIENLIKKARGES